MSLPDTSPLKTEDITQKLSKGAQALLAPKVHNTLVEYLEERPYKKTFASVITRAIKKAILTVAYRIIYRNPLGFVNAMILNRYKIVPFGTAHKFFNLLETWKWETYIHTYSRILHMGVTTPENRLEEAYQKLSDQIEFGLGAETVKGSLAGAVLMEIYTGTLSREFILIAHVHTTRAFSNMAHELMGNREGCKKLAYYGIIPEGAMPPRINEVVNG